jgi:hypothetical protein
MLAGCQDAEEGARSEKKFIFQGAHRVKIWYLVKKNIFYRYPVHPLGHTWIRQCRQGFQN